MATQYLVGPTRTYTTIQAAIDAIPSNLSGTGIHNVVIDAGIYDTGFGQVLISKTNGSAVDYVSLECASGSEHRGSITTGVRLTSLAATLSFASTSYTRLSNLVVITTAGGTAEPIQLSDHCLLVNVIGKTVSGRGFSFSGASATLINCLAICSSDNNAEGFNLSSNSIAYNCGAYGFRYPFLALGSSCTVINCWGANAGISSFNPKSDFGGGVGTWSASCSNNASTDSTAPGVNSLLSKTISQLGFVSTSAQNFHLTQTSILIGAGVDKSNIFVTDFDLETITTWSIGPDVQVAPRALVADESVCPIGSFYAADDFEDGAVDSTTMWQVDGIGSTISVIEENGAVHRTGSISSSEGVSVGIRPRSMSFSGLWKLYVSLSATSMDDGSSDSIHNITGTNYFGMYVERAAVWSRYFGLRRKNGGGQQELVRSTSTSTPTFTTLVATITPGTIVDLSLEFDGVNLSYKYNGVVIFAEVAPVGIATTAYAFVQRYISGGPNVNAWFCHFAYFWPYSGVGKLPCGGLQGPYQPTSSKPSTNQQEKSNRHKDARPPSLNKQSPEAAPKLTSKPIESSQNYSAPQYKKGYKDGFISIIPEQGGYMGSANLGTGNKVGFIRDTLSTGKSFFTSQAITPSRAQKERTGLSPEPVGGFTFPLKSNDCIPLFMSHFQNRYGTTPANGTSYFEFYPAQNARTIGGSSFGTGSYVGTTYNAFSVSVFKSVAGSAYHFKGGICDKLSFNIDAGKEVLVTPEFKFSSGTIVPRNSVSNLGSYSLLDNYTSFNSPINFLGLDVTSLDIECSNNLKKTDPVGTHSKIYKFGRHEVKGKVAVDVSKQTMAYIGSMLGGTSFSVYGTFFNNNRDKVIYQMPNCRLDPFNMSVGNSLATFPFRAYESEDGLTPAIKFMIWTQNYSATSFQPN